MGLKQRLHSTLASCWPGAAKHGPALNGTVSGPARLDRRTKSLCLRLKPGEIAVIDHADLDGAAAYAIVERAPAAVINTARSITGRYPNSGPGILIKAGIPLLDGCGAALFDTLREGTHVEIHGNEIWVDGAVAGHGTVLTREIVEEQVEIARGNLAHEIRAFSRNTLEYLDREADTAVDDLVLPELSVNIKGRPVLVVVRGEGYRQDLQWVKPYIREQKPVLIAVDGGADALISEGFKPDLIIGDMDSATDQALKCGAQLVVHTYPDGRTSPGLERIKKLRLPVTELPAPGTSEDVAMLLAYQCGAALIAVVGTHFSLVEFLDKRRAGMASTFLTRLKVGSILVDAKGLSRLYRPGASPGLIGGMLVSAALPVLVVMAHSPALQRSLWLARMSIEVWLRRHHLR